MTKVDEQLDGLPGGDNCEDCPNWSDLLCGDKKKGLAICVNQKSDHYGHMLGNHHPLCDRRHDELLAMGS